MAFQVKVEYGGKRFATFLLENVSYDGLVSSIRENNSSLAHLDADKITLRYRGEDGDMVNVYEADLFASSEMLRTAKEVKDRDYKKIFIQANEMDSPCPHKMKRVDFDVDCHFNNNNNLLRYFNNNTWHYLFKHKSYFVDEISCLSNIVWKTKAAVDLHTKASMLLKGNKTFALISNSLKRLYLSVLHLHLHLHLIKSVNA